jgi:hypothetical protein
MIKIIYYAIILIYSTVTNFGYVINKILKEYYVQY